MDIFTAFVMLMLMLMIIYKNWEIGCLEEENKKLKEQCADCDYYYKLAEALWDKYREYEIFPSRFARSMDEMSRWY